MRVLNRNIPVLIVLLVLVATLPVLGEGIILHEPDRRAIPMLVSKNQNLRKYGTGVVVGPTTILTAEHVTAERMEVLLPKAAVTGQTICRARYEDLAVVKAPLPKNTPYYRLSFRTPAVGETVRVGGYPNRKWQVTTGRITHIIASATLSGRLVKSPMIVFKPALHQGASGSPVLDNRGQVIGIFVASNRQSNYSIAFPNATALQACRKFVR